MRGEIFFRFSFRILLLPRRPQLSVYTPDRIGLTFTNDIFSILCFSKSSSIGNAEACTVNAPSVREFINVIIWFSRLRINLDLSRLAIKTRGKREHAFYLGKRAFE